MITFRCTFNPKDLPYNKMRTQYFINDFFKYNKDEVFIDCGAFNGDSIERFLKISKRNKIVVHSIVAFEPDAENFRALKKTYGSNKRITLYNAGVWNKEAVLKFNSDGSSSAIDESNVEYGLTSIAVKRIDDCKECANATFIKMDVEGSELNALRGALKTILKNKPKLAICIYHSNEDMLSIPIWIHDNIPEYKIYIRQHSNTDTETVLYATI